jgi:arylsulfatase A-like enzyme
LTRRHPRRVVRRGTRARLAVACALALLAPACERTRQAAGPGDVILLVVDTLRAQSLSLHGYERETSPNLEAFARDAVTYERAVTPGTWTVPAHGSLLTGLWPSYHGAERVPGDRVLALPVNPEVATLAEILHAHGFRTGGFVANSTYLSRLFGFDRGFQHYFEDFEFVRASAMLSRAGDWLAADPAKAFLFVNVLDPHEPFEPPPPFDSRFPGRDPRFGTMLAKLLTDGQALTPEVRAHFLSQYDGEIAYTDQALGAFLARLRELGRYAAALVIVTSDHGELLGEHGLVGHGLEPFEPLVRVPLLVKYPGSRDGGTRIARRVSTLGVFATVLETAGIPVPGGVHSVPLGEPHPVYVEDVDPAGRRVRVAYQGERKLVAIEPGGAARQLALYDLASDPGEKRPDRSPDATTLLADLDAFAARPRPVNLAQRPVIDPEREARLRALGYVR